MKLLAYSPPPIGKATVRKANFIPCMYLNFQNNPFELLGEKKLSLLLIFNLSFNFKLLINLAGKNTLCFLCVVL